MGVHAPPLRPDRVQDGPAGAPTTYPGRPKPAARAAAAALPAAGPGAAFPAAPDFASGLNDEWVPRCGFGEDRAAVSFSALPLGMPYPDVRVERFKAIVRRASTRWGLRAARTTSRRVRNRDGQNQVGFSWCSHPARSACRQTLSSCETRIDSASGEAAAAAARARESVSVSRRLEIEAVTSKLTPNPCGSKDRRIPRATSTTSRAC